MSLHQQPELKKAVLSLTQKEKDKLLVRLISKDKMLVKQLHFQLLEDEYDLEQRIISLREKLTDTFAHPPYPIRNTGNLSYILALNRLIKQCSGMVNEHEKVTKDKTSELEFRILILAESIERYPQLFGQSHLQSSQKLYKYVAGRIKHLLGKYDKLHEDLQFDFRENIQQLLDFGYDSPIKPYLSHLNIPTGLD